MVKYDVLSNNRCSKPHAFTDCRFFSCRDYRPIPALDVYDPTALDDEDYDELDPEARQEAERQMRKRDREDAAARGRLHRGLLYGILC